MPAMTTGLTEFSDNGDSRTYTLDGHTALDAKLVIQRRRVPVGNQTVAESSFEVIYATDDADGIQLPEKVAFMGKVRYPIKGTQADIDAALAVFRDIIAGDEFANTVNTQEWLS